LLPSESKTCAVCLDEKKEELICGMQCSHIVCDKCAIKWIAFGNKENRLKCPVCRQDMFPRKIILEGYGRNTREATAAAGQDEEDEEDFEEEELVDFNEEGLENFGEEEEEEEEEKDELDSLGVELGEVPRPVEETSVVGGEIEMGTGQTRVLDAIGFGGGGVRVTGRGGGGGGGREGISITDVRAAWYAEFVWRGRGRDRGRGRGRGRGRDRERGI
jgi:Zinc finger, C3HC4 type (RING finger)